MSDPEKPYVPESAAFVVGSPLNVAPISTAEISLRERERELEEAHRIFHLIVATKSQVSHGLQNIALRKEAMLEKR